MKVQKCKSEIGRFCEEQNRNALRHDNGKRCLLRCTIDALPLAIRLHLDETISFNGQIDDMFDFSVISDSWDHIIDGCIQTVGGLVTAVGGVAGGVGSCGLAIL